MDNKFEQMVDAVLMYRGTPRENLFEYPYRDDESRRRIEAAEALVRELLRIQGSIE